VAESTLTLADRRALEALNFRLRTILPEEYQDTDQTLEPKPMKSAGLKFDADGKVAWDEIWGSFCDLAMAGGPPHKGALLEPGTRAAIDAAPDRYAEVAAEICRGIALATDLEAHPSPLPGWVRITCLNDAMAGWLLRAITMENVAGRAEGARLDLPAAPAFRLDKEIKNVVTVAAKTCHYFLGHMPMTQRRRVAYLFATLNESSPLIQPAWPEDDGVDAAALAGVADRLADAIERDTGLTRSRHRYAGWLGVEIGSVKAAIWMMRALVVSNVLARREETTLFVPIDPVRDAEGGIVLEAITRTHHLAASITA
jgi:hypothetical protein